MRIVFIGTGEIGVPTLGALLNSEHEVVGIVTQPDKPVGREQRIEPPAIKKAIAKSSDFSLKERRFGQPSIGNVTAGKPSFLEAEIAVFCDCFLNCRRLDTLLAPDGLIWLSDDSNDFVLGVQ